MDSDCTNDLSCWHHCTDKRWIVDPVLKQCWHAGISMVFYQNSMVYKEVIYYNNIIYILSNYVHKNSKHKL